MAAVAQEAVFRIRNFGNDRDYDNVDELIDGLVEHYRGMSVAVHVRTPQYGMTMPFFVDVSENGEVFETYAEVPNKLVNVERIREAATS